MRLDQPTLTTAVIVELLTETDAPTLVRSVRPLAVRARLRPYTVTPDELALLTDLVKVKARDHVVPGIPATAVPALAVTIRREHPDLDEAAVRPRARDLAQAALDARAGALAVLSGSPR